MKDFSLFYALTKAIMKPGLHIYYPEIHIENPENFPLDGPVLLCGNHVNAFMDAVALQLCMPRQIYSMARGDAFNPPFLKWLLTKWKLIPIYRQSEGAEHLHKNEASFANAQSILSQGNCLIIYPEGICVQENRIRKLKKGAARIAFGLEDAHNFNAGLKILPVGMNYSHPSAFGSSLVISFGKPITLEAYKIQYQRNKVLAMNAFTADLEFALRQVTLHIPNPADEPLVDLLCQANNSSATNQSWLDTFKQKQAIVNDLLSLKQSNPMAYGPNNKQRTNRIKSIQRILGFPIYLLGVILNGIPYLVGFALGNKLAKNIEFKASLKMPIAWIFWLLYILILSVLIFVNADRSTAFTLLTVIMGTGLFVPLYVNRLAKQ